MFVSHGSGLVSQVDNSGAGHVIVSLLVVEKVRASKALLVVGVHLLAVHVLGAVESLAVLAIANITVGPFVFTVFTTCCTYVRRRGLLGLSTVRRRQLLLQIVRFMLLLL